MDERDEDDDGLVEIRGVPFIADKDFLGLHGSVYQIDFDPKVGPVLNTAAA
ncbi:hypothetical protein [Desulfoplanes sp.]